MRMIVALRDFVGAARNTWLDAVVVADAVKAAKALKAHYWRDQPGAVRGHLAEVHHAASFSLDAIRKGLPYRAARTNDGGPADIHIYHVNDPAVPLARAQVKTSVNRSTLVKAMSHPKYDGMQKVVNAGAQDPARGLFDRLKYGGASSSPISTQGLNRAVSDPRAYFESMLLSSEQAPSSWQSAAFEASAAKGPTIPPAVRAVLVRALLRIRTLTSEDWQQAGSATAGGAAMGGAGSLATVLSGSAAVGGASVAAVTAALALHRCGGDADCMWQEAVAQAAALGGGMGVAAACGALLAGRAWAGRPARCCPATPRPPAPPSRPRLRPARLAAMHPACTPARRTLAGGAARPQRAPGLVGSRRNQQRLQRARLGWVDGAGWIGQRTARVRGGNANAKG